MNNERSFFSKLIMGALLALLALSSLPSQALAYSLDIRNPYNDKMFVAIVDFEDQAGTWRTEGWFTVNPMSTKRISRPSSTKKRNIYLYVKTSEAAWDGAGIPSSITRTVVSNAFKYYQGQAAPSGSNRRQELFAKYELEDGFLYWSPE